MMFSIIARTMSHPDVGVACVAQYERMCSHLRFDSLMAGVVLALIQNKATSAPVLPVRFVRWLLVPGVIVLLWVLPVAGNDYVVDRVGLILIWGVAAILVGYASLDRGYVLEVPVLRRVLEYMGSRSYALYLVHDDISRLETMARNRWHLYARLVPWREHDTRPFLVMFLGSLLAAELLHRIIEKPLMRVGARRIGAFLKGEAGGGAPEGVAAVS
jgi:peptidoglycan/LPS O-acetylase OafA/YrhL